MDSDIGQIHSYETFGTVDGPGIRFVVFMQGCQLHCKYCHNRDTWNLNCGHIVNVSELYNKIVKYQNYIKPSGGGITISGGEPLLQSKFLISLFKKLKQDNFHLAIDTSGMVDLNDNIKKVLSYTDLVLLDIKHIDPVKCKNLVGFSNEKEIAFAKYLDAQNIPVWIRQVIVPGYTNDENDLLKLKEFISTLNNVKKIELLPYHSHGQYKWQQLGIPYALQDVPDATSNDISKAKEILGIN